MLTQNGSLNRFLLSTISYPSHLRSPCINSFPHLRYITALSPLLRHFLPNNFSTFTPNTDLLQSKFQPTSRSKPFPLNHSILRSHPPHPTALFNCLSDIGFFSVFIPPALNYVGSHYSSESPRFGSINGILLHRVYRRWPSKDFARLPQIGLPPDHRNAKAFGLFGAASYAFLLQCTAVIDGKSIVV